MVSKTAAKFCPWTPSREYITGHFLFPCFYCCSVGKSFPTPMVYMQHASFLCPPLSPRVCSDSYPLSWWCYLTHSYSINESKDVGRKAPHSSSFQFGGVCGHQVLYDGFWCLVPYSWLIHESGDERFVNGTVPEVPFVCSVCMCKVDR